MRFVDTNILLYAVSNVPEESSKSRVALDLLESDDLCLSVQVLQEFYVQATHAHKRDRLSHKQAVLLVEAFLRFPVQEGTLVLMQAALRTNARFQISYWDAAIIEAARLMECTEVLSEDLGDGCSYDGIVVHNPFAAPETG